MPDIKINKHFIEKDGKTIAVLYAEDTYPSMEKLSGYLGFIKKLVSATRKPDFIASREEYEYLVYYSFLYFLVNLDSLFYSKHVPLPFWFNFKKCVDDSLDKKETDVILDYKYGNVYVFKEYIKRKFGDIKLSVINRNRIINVIFNNLQYLILMAYFIFRSIIRKLLYINKKPKKEFDMLFITNYDRYYGNNRFFGGHLFNDKDFINLTKNLSGTEPKENNKSILYFKPGFTGIVKYIKNLKDKSSNLLFLEDVLYIRSGIKILLHWIFNKNNYKVDLKENLNDDEEFILEMYNDFLLNKLPFVLWFHLSIKDFVRNKRIKLIVGDSDKSFMFFLFNSARRFTGDKVDTIAFSHEIVSANSPQIPLSKNFKDIPDHKLVWNENTKNLLIKEYNFPEEKVLVFSDPRFLYWKKMPVKEKTILFVSTCSQNFYNDIFDTFENKKDIVNKLISKGYLFYFKPHPGEIAAGTIKPFLNRVKEIKEIKTITELNFIPKYSIGQGSTLQYELLSSGGKTYLLTDQNIFLIDEKEFEKNLKNNISDALLDILNKGDCSKSAPNHP